jgi:hypothetical protein
MQEAHLGCESKERGMSGIARKLFNRSARLWMWDEIPITTADHSSRPAHSA